LSIISLSIFTFVYAVLLLFKRVVAIASTSGSAMQRDRDGGFSLFQATLAVRKDSSTLVNKG
jgi:hypothetical protein